MKPDWDKSKERFDAWWHGEAVDRVLLQVTAPKRGLDGISHLPMPDTPEARWLDIDYRIAALERQMEQTYYGGDAFPCLFTNMGAGIISNILGCPAEFRHDTVWCHPCLGEIAAAELPSGDENNRYWKWVQEFARTGAEHFRGRAMVGFPDLIGGLDLLAQLLGNEKLLWALADEGQHVHRLQSGTSDAFLRYYDPIYQIIKDETGGSSWGCFDTYGAGRMAVVQCDFSGMISAAMFEEYCVPYLAEVCERVDQAVYHLDGSCALQHVDPLLTIDSLAAIQWTPGTGSLPPATDESWIPLYRQIRAAGKAVMVRGGYARDVHKLVEELGPEGLDIAIYVASQDEAEELVRQSFSWKKA